MARTKEFDCDRALEGALRVFWRKGYEATSIQDLVDATGVNRASLYETFGTKRKLFRKALERYAGSKHNVAQATAETEAGMARIRAALELAAEQTLKDGRGCMIVNAIVERAGQDREMRRIGARTRAQLEDFFAGSLAEAERRGEIRSGQDRKALARFLTNALFGLRVVAKTGGEKEEIRAIVRTTLERIAER
jgi:TetR/AcrR family transcriptional repressor of nem operon